MDTDYVMFFVFTLIVVVGAGLFRVGLMNLKSGAPGDTRKARLLIALGISFGIGAVLIIMLRVVKIGG